MLLATIRPSSSYKKSGNSRRHPSQLRGPTWCHDGLSYRRLIVPPCPGGAKTAGLACGWLPSLEQMPATPPTQPCVSLQQACHTAPAIVSLGTKHSGSSDSVHKQPLTHAREALSQQLYNDLIDQFLCLFRVPRRAKLSKPLARGRYK